MTRKAFIVGCACMIVAIVIGVVLNRLQYVDHWMSLLGLIGCLLSAFFIGALSRGLRMDSQDKTLKQFRRLAGPIFGVCFPNLIAGIIVYHSLH